MGRSAPEYELEVVEGRVLTPLQQIGANIRSLRARAGMILSQVGEDQGFSKASISEWERGASEPGATNLHALACCFGVPMERFFEGVVVTERAA